MNGAPRTTIGNEDLIRLILWFCAEKTPEKDVRLFKSITKLQKLIFVAQKEEENFLILQRKGIYVDQPFVFSADNFGPFSVDLTKLLNKMRRVGEFEMDKNGTSTCFITKLAMKEKLSEIKDLINDDSNVQNLINALYSASKLSLDELLKYVYQNPKYDEYLINSTIRSKYS